MTSTTPALTENNVPRQDGRVFLVVGGDVGPGYELCRMLYRTGARVYMTSPSEVSTPILLTVFLLLFSIVILLCSSPVFGFLSYSAVSYPTAVSYGTLFLLNG
jgi:hypothetical protein